MLHAHRPDSKLAAALFALLLIAATAPFSGCGITPGDGGTDGGTDGNTDGGTDGNTDASTDGAVYPHPVGWSDPTVHGYRFMRDPSVCKACHGEALTGGTGGTPPSCDSCHSGGDAWRTDCTFCHGGTDNDTGAPPRGIFGDTARTYHGVGAHTAHVETTALHSAFDCAVCHVKPSSVADAGHVDPGGLATVTFSATAGASAAYSASNATCSALYCHGNGRSPSGAIAWTTDPTLGCSSCHPTNGLSGRHGKHIGEGVSCSRCHADTAASASAIATASFHVNGTKDVRFSGGGTWNAGNRSCSGVCHGTKTW